MTDATHDATIVDLAADDARWAVALPVLQQLRPHLTKQRLDEVLRDGAPQGLRFTAVFVEEKCVAIAGWRIVVNTSAGRKMYIDDLSTDVAERSRGYGSLLLGELRERAIAAGCTRLDLDSGVQRFDAHRFYLRERMNIVSHHFSQTLDATDQGSR